MVTGVSTLCYRYNFLGGQECCKDGNRCLDGDERQMLRDSCGDVKKCRNEDIFYCNDTAYCCASSAKNDPSATSFRSHSNDNVK